MIVGVPKEIKNNENRVGMTPGGVKEFVKRGHTVYVQHTAGEGSGFDDSLYLAAGAQILDNIKDVYNVVEMIVKVKEPIEEEYKLIKKGQLLFTYFHFASNEKLLNAMLQSGVTCLAYETVLNKEGLLPLLIPMSEIAGRMAIQVGMHFMEKSHGGRGILLGGVSGVSPARVLVLGGGIVGYNAAVIAAGAGAQVTITDISLSRLRYLDEVLPANVQTLYSSVQNVEEVLPYTDLVIGSVLIPGAKAPHLLTRDMLKLMKKGSVVVDVAIDQGGCFETSHATTHTDPVYEEEGVIHYAVANIPGAVARTSTLALTNATLPYALKLADLGWEKAVAEDAGLKSGLNIVDGKITFKAVAEVFGKECHII